MTRQTIQIKDIHSVFKPWIEYRTRYYKASEWESIWWSLVETIWIPDQSSKNEISLTWKRFDSDLFVRIEKKKL